MAVLSARPAASWRPAREARLSPFHFLRTFELLTGITPHQYLRRARLRNAATRIASSHAKILDVALDCGFGDVTNFNRAFRTEFGMSPRAFRRARGDPGEHINEAGSTCRRFE